MPQRWDTTRFTDGTYDLCNIVTDNAGYTATATLRITILNAVPVPPPIPAPLEPAGAAPVTPVVAAPAVVPGTTGATGGGARPRTTRPPRTRPRRLAVVQPRSRTSAPLVPLTLRWVNPKADDLDRVVVVLNLKRQPRGKGDGTVVYSGLRPSTTFKLRPG